MVIENTQAEGADHCGELDLEGGGLRENVLDTIRNYLEHLHGVLYERLSSVQEGSDEGDDTARVDVDGRRGDRLLNVLDVGSNVVDSIDSLAGNFADADQVVDLLLDLRDTFFQGLPGGRDGLAATRQGVQLCVEVIAHHLKRARFTLRVAREFGERAGLPLKNLEPIHRVSSQHRRDSTAATFSFVDG